MLNIRFRQEKAIATNTSSTAAAAAAAATVLLLLVPTMLLLRLMIHVKEPSMFNISQWVTKYAPVTHVSNEKG